jgi:predicted nucleic acid-binding protein
MEFGLTFDTGALIALERRSQRMTDVFRRATERGVRITVPAAVVTEWWRGQRRRLFQDLLASFEIEPLDPRLAQTAGLALAATGGSNAVDAIVVASAAQRGDLVYTSDFDDLARLGEHFRGVRILVT